MRPINSGFEEGALRHDRTIHDKLPPQYLISSMNPWIVIIAADSVIPMEDHEL